MHTQRVSGSSTPIGPPTLFSRLHPSLFGRYAGERSTTARAHESAFHRHPILPREAQGGRSYLALFVLFESNGYVKSTVNGAGILSDRVGRATARPAGTRSDLTGGVELMPHLAPPNELHVVDRSFEGSNRIVVANQQSNQDDQQGGRTRDSQTDAARP